MEDPIKSTVRPMIFFISFPHSSIRKESSYGWSEYSYRYLAESIENYFIENDLNVIIVDSEETLNSKVKEFEAEYEPIHLIVGPPNSAFTSLFCKNILIFAWEFPDIPCHSVNGDVQNNWLRQFELFDEIYTLSDFATNSVRKVHDGIVNTLPIELLQTANSLKGRIESAAEVYINILNELAKETSREIVEIKIKDTISLQAKRFYFIHLNPLIPNRIGLIIRSAYKKFFATVETEYPDNAHESEISKVNLEDFCFDKIILSSWLNPFDSRKNFHLLLDTAAEFIKNHESVVLLLKLHCNESSGVKFVTESVRMVAEKYDISPASFGFIFDYLDEHQSQLVRSSVNLYLNVSSGEGLCWPVLEHLTVGVPVVIPNNTIFQEYRQSSLIFKFECDVVSTKFPINRRNQFDTYTFPPIQKSLRDKLLEGFVNGKKISISHDKQLPLNSFLRFDYKDGILYELF